MIKKQIKIIIPIKKVGIIIKNNKNDFCTPKKLGGIKF
jgi:hypothetical protein